MDPLPVSSTFPVIDLSSKKLQPGTSHWAETRDRVRKAMEEYGAFVAEFEDLSLDHHDAIMKAMTELYALPDHVKVQNLNHKASHGYMTMEVDGYRIHESLGIDYSTEKEACEKFTKLMWPEGNDRFCELANSYAKIQSGLYQKVMKMLFESYGVEDSLFESHVAAVRYLLRLLSYRKHRNGEANTSFNSHTDKNYMTILHQNHIRGLELKSPTGEWVSFEPSPTRFAVLAGDGLMVWSNDRIQSCYHRVVMEGDETRLALGFFTFGTAVTEVPVALVDEEHPLKYRPFDQEKLLRFYDGIEMKKRSPNLMTKVCFGIDADGSKELFQS